MIASIVERRATSDPPIPVMVVTGDRDAYQLVDDGVRIMTTSRGITDTKVYDREGVIDRYGIPPELVPDFIGLKGDTSDNIPGVPGIGDKTAADLLQRFGSLEEVLEPHRRHQRRQAQAEPDRARRRRADLQAAGHGQARHPDRARPRRRSSRQPPGPLEAARHVPRVRAPRAAAPPRGGARLGRRRRAGAGGRASRSPRACARRQVADVARLPETEVAVAVRAPETSPRTRCSRPMRPGRSAVHADGAAEVLAGTCDAPAELVAQLGKRPVIAHDAKSLGEVPRGARPRHRGRRLPARAGAPRVPVPRAVRGARPGRCGRWRGRRRRAAGPRARRLAARGDPRARPDRPAHTRSSCRSSGSCATWRSRGLKLDTERLREISDRVKDEADRARARDLRPVRRPSSCSARPRQLEEVLFGTARPVAQAPRQDRLLDRRPRAPGDPRTSTR